MTWSKLVEQYKMGCFLSLVEEKGGNVDSIKSDPNGIYSFKTKHGVKKTYAAFNTKTSYQKSNLYPNEAENVNGFYFVPLKRERNGIILL